MVETITAQQRKLLQWIGAHPGVSRDQLLKASPAAAGDVAYLEKQDLVREREPGLYRVTHLGEMALKRGL